MPLPQYVGRVYSRETFRERVAKLKFDKGFRPNRVVQHSTGSPTLSQVMKDPNNHLTRMLNMELDYEHRLGWHHTPHLFIFPPYPGQEDGLIGEMNSLDIVGVHSSCDNHDSLGVEHVGYYSKGHDDWSTGAGAKVRDLGIFAMALLYKAMATRPDDKFVLHKSGHHFHCECAHDGHSICPGPLISKPDQIRRIAAQMKALDAPPSPPLVS